MTRLSLMDESSGTGRTARSVAPASPPVRKGVGPGQKRDRWDIAWLGGRSSAPWVVLAAALVLLVAIAGTVYTALRPTDVGYGVRAYTVTSDRQVVVTLQVERRPAATVSCTVEAQGVGTQTVGSVTQVIPPGVGGPHTVEPVVTVPTSQRALSVTIASCRVTSTG